METADSQSNSEEEVSLKKINASLPEIELLTDPTANKFPLLSVSKLYKALALLFPIFFAHTTAPEVSSFNIKDSLLFLVYPLT